MIKAIIFDAFGTLIQVTGGASARQIVSYIRDSGKNLDEEDFFAEWKDFYKKYTSSEVCFMTERDIFILRIDMFYKRYGVSRNAEDDVDMQLLEANKRDIYEEVLGVLSALREKYQILIGSNTDNSILDAVMKKNGLIVDRVYTSESLKCYKPSKDFYLSIINDAGLDPEEVLFVGDSLLDDIYGPQQVNMKTCWVNRDDKAVEGINPDYIVRDLMELQTLLP